MNMEYDIGLIKERIEESIQVKEMILGNYDMLCNIRDAALMINNCLDGGGKILLCGNGGSASDALHLAGEFVGRFQKERKAIPAIALNADIAAMTAIANDYGYDRIFARAVEGLMTEKDVLIGISTSGNSENVYNAILTAKRRGGKTIAFVGKGGGKIKEITDILLMVPCEYTARVQEAHITIGHIICELVEGQ